MKPNIKGLAYLAGYACYKANRKVHGCYGFKGQVAIGCSMEMVPRSATRGGSIGACLLWCLGAGGNRSQRGDGAFSNSEN